MQRFLVAVLLCVVCAVVATPALPQTGAATGSITDPAGDASHSSINPVPDLVSGSVTASGGSLAISVRFAPGTFNPQTIVQVSLDLDQNPQTGHPGTTSAGGIDARVIGNEYAVNFSPGPTLVIFRHAGCVNCFTSVAAQGATITVAGDGYDATIPLSLLGNDDGALNFKMTASVKLSENSSSGILDWMPDADIAGGSTQQVQYFRATPTTIARGQSATLSWATLGAASVTIDNGVGAVPATGTVLVQPSQTTTYTLSATRDGQTDRLQATVEVVATPAIVITGFPRGMTQLADSAGGTDRLVITNIGGAAGTVNLDVQGSFFTVTPQSFSIAPGADQVVAITALPQPANAYAGSITLSGDGVEPGTSAQVRLLSAAPPAAPVVAAVDTPRVDVSSAGNTLVEGTFPVRNDGAAPLQGIAVSDALWVTPEAGLITIAPGQSRDLRFTIDPAKRVLEGSETAKIAILYFTSDGSTGRLETLGGPREDEISISLVHTKNPNVVAGPIPAIGAGSIAHIITGLPRGGSLIPQVFALNRPRTATSVDVQLHYLPAGASNQGLTAAYAAVAPSASILLKDLRTVFSSTAGSATVQVRSQRFDDVAVSASIITNATRGLFGTYLAPFRSDRSAGSGGRILLAGLRREANTKITLYLQEIAGTASRAETVFYDAAGNLIETRNDTPAASSLLELVDVVPAGAVSAIVTNRGAGKLIARALITETSSGDVTDLVDWTQRNALGFADDQLVPVTFSALPSNAQTQVEMTIFNGGFGALSGNLSWVPLSSSMAPRRRPVRTSSSSDPRLVRAEEADVAITVPRFGSMTITDVLRELGVAAGSTGYIRFSPQSGTATITARLRHSSSLRGMYGTTLPVVGALAGLAKSESKEFSGIEAAVGTAKARPGTYQSSLALLESDGKPVRVRATLHYTGPSASGRTSGLRGQESKEYSLAANAVIHLTDLARDILGVERDLYGDLHDMRLDLVVTEGDGLVVPLVIATENATSDAILRLD